MKRFLLLAIVLPLTAATASEPSRTEFSFRVRRATATVRLATDGGDLVKRLHIKFSDPRIPEQIIPCGDMSLLPGTSDPGFESADYDRNGYIDFSLSDSGGTAANHIRHFLFYSPAKRSFQRRRDIDESGVSDYDPTTGLFGMYWRGNASSSGGATYRLEHGRLRLLRSVKRGFATEFRDILPTADEYAEYRVTTLHLPGGRIRRFYKYVGQ